MNIFGLARLGRDAELRYTPEGKAVCALSLAFNVYVKREKSVQWVEGVLWDKRAESLAPYLLKGTAVSVLLRDVHIESYQKGDGTPASKLVGTVVEIELAGRAEGNAGAPAPAAAPRTAPAPQPARQGVGQSPSRPATGFDDMDNDIPF